ncbi:hypothetical protein ABB07_38045 [Streptomyces incarnatus]|uniref:Uncharacterized protein n=1 Tax=Streptomyces incarnatus TaxID=665007 RepID=A0ABM5TXI6_9ACTN|nr:hypothetical protein ABB07_38045 [Streptomyces incarnatus]
MPGMTETVLDIGLNDDSVLGLAKVSGSECFAWDSCRRLVQMYGTTVMGVDPALFDEAMTLLKAARDASDDPRLDAGPLAWLVEPYKRLIRDEAGRDFPQSPARQLHEAILAVPSLRSRLSLTARSGVVAQPDTASRTTTTSDPHTLFEPAARRAKALMLVRPPSTVVSTSAQGWLDRHCPPGRPGRA